ncbi:MAG: VanZ family protein [Bacteroidota bacterium]
MLKRNRYTLLFISWVLFLTTLSLFSFSDLDTGTVRIPYADKITHFGFYSIFVVLAAMVFRERTQGKIPLKRALIWAFLAAVFYGMLIEGLQHTVTEDRMAEWSDVLANTIGAFAGVLLIKWYFSKERPLKWKF